jgi:hypothetical protein
LSLANTGGTGTGRFPVSKQASAPYQAHSSATLAMVVRNVDGLVNDFSEFLRVL